MAPITNPSDYSTDSRLLEQLRESIARLQNSRRLNPQSGSQQSTTNPPSARPSTDTVEISAQARDSATKVSESAEPPGIQAEVRTNQAINLQQVDYRNLTNGNARPSPSSNSGANEGETISQETMDSLRAASANNSPAPLAASNQDLAAIATTIAAAFIQGQFGIGSFNQSSSTSSPQTETPTSSQTEPMTTNAPETATATALASTAQLGGLTISNIQETTDAQGNRTGATGQVDLSAYGLGMVDLNLTLEGDQIVGATSQQNSFDVNVGGNTFTVSGGANESVLTIDATGNTRLSGTATVDIAGQQLQIAQANVEFGRDANNNRTVSIVGSVGTGGAGTQVSVAVNENGSLSANVSSDIVGNLVPGFDRVTGFLERIGVDLSTGGGASIAFNRNEGSLAFDINGINGSFNRTTGDVSIGGLGVDAGIGIELENLTVNTQTGAVSGSVSAGFGVGIGDLGIGIDVAGFDFAYDPNRGDITLTGTQGIAAANLQATVVLNPDAKGGFGVKSVSFRANIDEELAREVAAGLNTAYQQGTALGAQAVDEMQRIGARGNAAVQDFAQGLQQAGNNTQAFINQSAEFTGQQLDQFLSAAASSGNRMGDLLTQTQRLTGEQLNNFLSTASSDGSNLQSFLTQTAALSGNDLSNFMKTASNAGNRLGTLLETTSNLSGSNLTNFLSTAASKGANAEAFVRDFSSFLKDVQNVSGGVANLSVDKNGGISGKINLPGVGSTSVSFSRENGNLVASGNLNLGGFAFSNARIEFNRNGGISSVSGGAKLSTPGFKIAGRKIGSQSVGFELGLDSGGRIVARGELSLNMGILGKHGARFTLGSGGFSVNKF